MKKILKSIVFVAAFLSLSSSLRAQVSVNVGLSVRIAPPALPVYAQPVCPGDGFLWTPGYWSYGDSGYYWVPGVWVRPPHYGVLWTPGYWGLDGGGIYVFHSGYWGRHVGFYGGINYGFGYVGSGFAGGMWAGNVYRYNTAVTNVNTTIVHNTYINNTVINRTTINDRTSFNGRGGINRTPSEQERSAMREQHTDPTQQQFTHQETARQDRNQLASFNHGRPGTPAMGQVNERRGNQQDRIANGISSGHLNAGESKNLENKEAGLNREIRTDKSNNDGHLTGQEHEQINRQQNNISNSIATDKHNGNNVQYGGNNEAGQRRFNQQQRIAQGIHRGQMGPNEVARAENRQQSINHNIRADRNGGRLSMPQQRHINQRQNKASRQIAHERHG